MESFSVTWHSALTLSKSGVRPHHSPFDRFLSFLGPISDDGHCTTVTTKLLPTSLWDFSLSRKEIESHLHLLMQWTFTQVRVIPFKAMQKPCVCPVHTPCCILFVSPLMTLALQFLAQVMNFNSLDEQFSESRISVGLKMSNWIGRK